MQIERKILANLAYRVYKARHRKNKSFKRFHNTADEELYWEALSEWVALHNAFQSAKHIYYNGETN